MLFLQEKIHEFLTKESLLLFPEWKGEVKVEYPGAESHGDYASNISFEIGKFLKKNPKDIAEMFHKNLLKPDWIKKIEIKGAGFLNFFLAPEFLTQFLEEIKKQGNHYGESNVKKGKTVVTDTSHPNVAKPMGVHHLLSTIIGNALNRILAATGYNVIRDNYIGDWGTQFGKLIYAYKTWGNEEIVKKNPIPELLKLYVKFHEKAEKNEKLEETGRQEFKKLEDGDEENRALWKWVVSLSLQEFQKLYDRLKVSFDVIHGESFYEDKMQVIIESGIKKKVFVEGESGALIAPFANKKYPPCLIRKSDGATLYATRDLARTKYWEDTWHPDLMLIVADSAQNLHFQQFFEVAKMLDITDAQNIHVNFGRMRFPEKRMSTRKGNIVLMEELLDEAEDLAYKIVCEKNPELKEEKKQEIGRQIGIGAVKYAILAQNRLTDITFTWGKMLSLEGNSAPYIQYAHARGCSILRKVSSIKKQVSSIEYTLNDVQELAVARILVKFPEVVFQAAEEFKPNLICNYLFELATKFNTFYAALPVLQAPLEIMEVRLNLVEAVTLILKNGLNLLGIEAPEEM